MKCSVLFAIIIPIPDRLVCPNFFLMFFSLHSFHRYLVFVKVSFSISFISWLPIRIWIFKFLVLVDVTVYIYIYISVDATNNIRISKHVCRDGALNSQSKAKEIFCLVATESTSLFQLFCICNLRRVIGRCSFILPAKSHLMYIIKWLLFSYRHGSFL